jgi:transcription elongation factor GreA
LTESHITLIAAVTEYLASISEEQHKEAQVELGKFVRWCGRDRDVWELRPADVEEYVQRAASSTTVGAVIRMSQLQAFFSYANKKHLSGQNLAPHVKVRGRGSRARREQESNREALQVVELTQDGFKRLQEELESLQKERTRIARDIRSAAADKDVRENAPLEAARQEQGMLEARIRTIEASLRLAVVADGKSKTGGKRVKSRVALGNNILLREMETGQEVSYLLVNPQEADLLGGRLSVKSPVGEAILGHFIGDEIDVVAPRGKIRYCVIDVIL